MAVDNRLEALLDNDRPTGALRERVDERQFAGGIAQVPARFPSVRVGRHWVSALWLVPLAAVGLIVVIAVVSIWTPLGWQYVAERWFTMPNFFWFLPVPLLVALFSVLIWSLTRNPASHSRPFLLTLGLIFLGFSGLGISLWPNIIPPRITLWEAAAPPASQLFMLVGTLLIIPVILVYTAWSYYVFRGKVSDTEGYH